MPLGSSILAEDTGDHLLVLLRNLGTKDIKESKQPIEKNGNPGEKEEISPGPVPASHERHQRNEDDVHARKQSYRLDDTFLISTQFHTHWDLTLSEPINEKADYHNQVEKQNKTRNNDSRLAIVL